MDAGDDVITQIAYRLRVMLHHVRNLYEGMAGDKNTHALASLFKIFDPDAAPQKKKASATGRRCPFPNFRESESQTFDDDEESAGTTLSP